MEWNQETFESRFILLCCLKATQSNSIPNHLHMPFGRNPSEKEGLWRNRYWRNLLCTLAGSLSCSVGVASAAERPSHMTNDRAPSGDSWRPGGFVHRIVKRESRYNPGLSIAIAFGLMQDQICDGARMGYKGDVKASQSENQPHLRGALSRQRLPARRWRRGSRRNPVQQRLLLHGETKEGARYVADRILSAVASESSQRRPNPPGRKTHSPGSCPSCRGDESGRTGAAQ